MIYNYSGNIIEESLKELKKRIGEFGGKINNANNILTNMKNYHEDNLSGNTGIAVPIASDNKYFKSICVIINKKSIYIYKKYQNRYV